MIVNWLVLFAVMPGQTPAGPTIPQRMMTPNVISGDRPQAPMLDNLVGRAATMAPLGGFTKYKTIFGILRRNKLVYLHYQK